MFEQLFGSNKAEGAYHKISPDGAKKMMDENNNCVLLDVRSKAEFQSGHIQGAKSLPLEEIPNQANAKLKDKDAVILTYCQSGMRSRTAAKTLVKLGYTKIYDFGGIMDWPYAIVR